MAFLNELSNKHFLSLCLSVCISRTSLTQSLLLKSSCVTVIWKFKNFLNCWKFWLNDTYKLWLSRNWKKLDVYSSDKYSFLLIFYTMKSLKTILIFCFRISVLPSSHVESSFISDKISRSCFFGSVIQLAKFTSYDVIVALTCEFAVAEYQTLVLILYLFRFKDVTFESFSTLWLLRGFTLLTCGHAQRN